MPQRPTPARRTHPAWSGFPVSRSERSERYQFFTKLHEAQVLKSSAAPRNFGQALVYLAIAMLVLGIGCWRSSAWRSTPVRSGDATRTEGAACAFAT
jgi:hypothetical protein